MVIVASQQGERFDRISLKSLAILDRLRFKTDEAMYAAAGNLFFEAQR